MNLNRIKEFLDYDPETGLFIWKRRTHTKGNGPAVGDIAGHVSKAGYVTIRFKGILYYGHRLAWFFAYGEMPCKIDHENRCKADNRIRNLRKATQQGNSANRNVRPDSRSGYKGVYAHQNGRFYAYIIVDGKKLNLGAFPTSEAAARAYDNAANDSFGEFARLNFGG